MPYQTQMKITVVICGSSYNNFLLRYLVIQLRYSYLTIEQNRCKFYVQYPQMDSGDNQFSNLLCHKKSTDCIKFTIIQDSSVNTVSRLRAGQLGFDSCQGQEREFFSPPSRPDRL
jgi:hypothetical protein